MQLSLPSLPFDPSVRTAAATDDAPNVTAADGATPFAAVLAECGAKPASGPAVPSANSWFGADSSLARGEQPTPAAPGTPGAALDVYSAIIGSNLPSPIGNAGPMPTLFTPGSAPDVDLTAETGQGLAPAPEETSVVADAAVSPAPGQNPAAGPAISTRLAPSLLVSIPRGATQILADNGAARRPVTKSDRRTEDNSSPLAPSTSVVASLTQQQDVQALAVAAAGTLPTTPSAEVPIASADAATVSDDATATVLPAAPFARPTGSPSLSQSPRRGIEGTPSRSDSVAYPDRGATPFAADDGAGCAKSDEPSPPAVPVADATETTARSTPAEAKTFTPEGATRPVPNETATASRALPVAAPDQARSDVAADVKTAANLVTPPAQTTAAAVASLPRNEAVENFAAKLQQNFGRPITRESGAVKSFVGARDKDVTRFAETLGIATAKPEITMPAGSTLTRSFASDPAAAPAVVTVSDVRPESSTLPEAVTLPSTAHRAVEAALSVADRFATRDQHSVNLQFSIGGNDLNVRVELRGGEVHTTFRTDSTELRSALASEWQSVATQSSNERPVRLATPVFASTEQASTSSSGDQTPRHREPPQQSGGATPSFTLTGQSRPGTTTTAAPAAPRARLNSSNSIHLHTLA